MEKQVLMTNTMNRNGHIYPKDEVEKALERIEGKEIPVYLQMKVDPDPKDVAGWATMRMAGDYVKADIVIGKNYRELVGLFEMEEVRTACVCKMDGGTMRDIDFTYLAFTSNPA